MSTEGSFDDLGDETAAPAQTVDIKVDDLLAASDKPPLESASTEDVDVSTEDAEKAAVTTEDPEDPEDIIAAEDAAITKAPVEPAFDFSSIGDGKYTSKEEINTAITDLSTQNSELKERATQLEEQLAVSNGTDLDDSTVTFNNLVKKMGPEKAMQLHSSIINFKHDSDNPVATILEKMIIETPSLGAQREALMDDLKVQYEDATTLERARITSEANRSAQEIEAIREEVKGESPDKRQEGINIRKEQAKVAATSSLKDIRVAIPGVDNLEIDYSEDAKKYESSFITYVTAGEVTDQRIAEGKAMVTNRLILDKVLDGSLAKSMKEAIETQVRKATLDAKSNPTIIKDEPSNKGASAEDKEAAMLDSISF